MTRASLANQPCTIVVPTADGTADRAGVPADTEDVYLAVGYFEQKQANDQTGAVDVDEQRWTYFLLPTANQDDTSGDTFDLAEILTARASIEPEGLGVFQLVGEPWPVRNPRTQVVEQIEGEMRRVSAGG